MWKSNKSSRTTVAASSESPPRAPQSTNHPATNDPATNRSVTADPVGTQAATTQPAMTPSPITFSSGLDPTDDQYSVQLVNRILTSAVATRATDIHLEASRGETRIRMRIDGNLTDCGSVANGSQTSILNRIKALARLVTYRTDIPQEGRIVLSEFQLEARVGTLPTLHGERAVIRLATAPVKLLGVEHLGLPHDLSDQLRCNLMLMSGVILISGPAGAGKTTTAYAALREIAMNGAATRSLVSLEDPIEMELPGVAQSQIDPAAGYDWASGLKALLRQDPEVLMIGEIRDPATAAIVFDAAMTGQLVITTLHARSAGDALRRLLDMQVPAHHLISGLSLLWSQRLVRQTCSCQRVVGSLSVDFPTQHVPAQVSDATTVCPTCGNSGYHGRLLLCESLPAIEKELARGLMMDADSMQLNRLARAAGMRPLEQQAAEAIAERRTTQAEIQRHFTI